MQPEQNIQPPEGDQSLEVVIGVFPTHESASQVAASLRGPDLQVRKISRNDPTAPDDLPQIVYDEIENVDAGNVVTGAATGGAIGLGSGLLMIGIPGLNIAAPIVGAIAGAWIGGVAGVDESVRGIELPNREDYQRMLQEGKSFVVIAGTESQRIEYANKMEELGAEAIHQHPPVGHAIRTTE